MVTIFTHIIFFISKASCEMRENMYCAKITTSRDWSLITERGGGGLQNGRGGGHVKFYTYKKGGGGAEKVLAMLKGGHKKFRGSFYAVA